MQHVRKFAKEIFGLTLFEGIKHFAFVLLLGAGSYAVALFSGQHFPLLMPYKWPIAIGGFAIGLLLLVWVIRRFSRRRPLFPLLDCEYHVLEKDVTFEYINPGNIIYKRRYRLRALRHGLEEFHDNYHWTGVGKCNLRSAMDDHEIRKTRERSVWKYFAIVFPMSLAKYEEVKTEVIWELDDVNGKAIPFISATISAPTDRLVMTVKLPNSLNVKKVTCEHAPSLGAKPFESHQKELIDGAAEWIIDFPNLLHHYEMRWNPHCEEKQNENTANTSVRTD